MDVLIYGQECGNKNCDKIRYKPITIKAKKKKRIWKKSYYKELRKLANGSIKWKSSKRKVATVSKSGVVKAKKKGTTFLRAKVTHKKYKNYPIYI